MKASAFTLILIAALATKAHAGCITIPGRDGAMEMSSCTTPDTPKTGGTSPPLGSFTTPSPQHNPTYHPPPPSNVPPFNPAATNTAAPKAILPVPPETSAPTPYSLPTSRSLPEMIAERDRGFEAIQKDRAETDARIAAASAGAATANAIAIGSMRATEKITREHFAKERDELEKWKGEQAERLDADLAGDEVVMRGEFGSIAVEARSGRATVTGPDGLIAKRHVANSEVRELRGIMKFRMGKGDDGQAMMAKLMNRILGQKAAWLPDHQVEGFRMATALTLGADQALADHNWVAASQLINTAMVGIDLALGFVPVLSSVNDATQVLFGVLTGYDYLGVPMDGTSYALRGAGIALGIGGARTLLRFGALAVDRISLSALRLSIPIDYAIARDIARSLGRVVSNELGAVGIGLAKLIHYQYILKDPKLFVAMMSALQPYQGTSNFITKAAHALSKHPMALNYRTMELLQKVHRGDAMLNAAAEDFVSRCLLKGKLELGIHKSLNNLPTFDHLLPSGYGARFSRATYEFIGIVEPSRL